MSSIFKSLIENIPAIFYRCKYDDNWTMLFINKAVHNLTGYPASDFILNEVRAFSSMTHPEDIDLLNASICNAVIQKLSWEIEYRVITSEGSVKWVSETGVGIFSETNELQYLDGFIMDISERKEVQEQLKFQSTRDTLTQLPNRYALSEFLEHEISRASRHHYFGAVLFLDLDKFKPINDSLGHAAGDVALQIVSDRLSQCKRKEDFLGRLGGDEFVLVLAELNADLRVAADLAQELAQRIIKSLEVPIRLSEHTLSVSSCIGIKLFPESQYETAGELLKQADIALYQAKSKGSGVASFFCEKMQKLVEQQNNLAKELRVALEQEQLFLHYQPQMTIDDQLFGIEALVRWNHPSRGPVGPDEFIPAAEEAGLINQLGCYVLHRALREWSRFLAGGRRKVSIKLAVNISPSHFLEEGFVDQIAQIVNAYDLSHCQLVLEITENVVIHNIDDISAKMKALRQLGIKISLDDFGTGYSSLAYIKRLPLDTLKIDRSFVHDIHTDPNDAAIVDAILAMTKSLGIEVIAEGVETQAHRYFLSQRGCNFYQGYLFSRPESLCELVKKGLFESTARCLAGCLTIDPQHRLEKPRVGSSILSQSINIQKS